MSRLTTTVTTLLLLAALAVAACGEVKTSSKAATSTEEVWSLERIRGEGSPTDGEPETERVSDSGIATRAYVVCDGPRSACKSDPGIREPYQHAALEVTQHGRSALFGLPPDGRYWAAGFDADSVFVMDDPLGDSGFSFQKMRFRLLRSDGSEVRLRFLDDPAPAVPGPDVFVIDHSWHVGDDVEAVYLVNEREGTLRPLDVPHAPTEALRSVYWGPNVDEFLWYVDRDCRVVWAADGTFETRRPDCAEGRDKPTYMHDEWFPDGWLRPGRMALMERSDDRLYLHVSLDYGSTWQRIPVSNEGAVPRELDRVG
jgi:hypothetical protein